MKGKDIRQVRGVRWANLVERPECIPLGRRTRGAKAAGLRYENLFARQFPQALHGPWFEYEDEVGHGYCQPDLILSYLPSCLVVLEIKYSVTMEAFQQLQGLYLPVVRVAMAAPVVGVVVARNLTNVVANTVNTLESAINHALVYQSIPILHWVGQPTQQDFLLNKPYPPNQIAFPTRHDFSARE